MPRRPHNTPLRVLLNNRIVGYLAKASNGAVEFHYDKGWLASETALPISLSLPLREDAYRGSPVIAVFDNLLPDADALRSRVAEKVGAAGTDAHSLLSAIGQDCVGALQFVPGDDEPTKVGTIDGEPVDDLTIEKVLKGLVQTPLGLSRDDPFRISVAGAQEKTALLRHEGQWIKPHGTTPTTHILKTQIGALPNGIDLSNSVENEFYCMKLAALCGLSVAHVDIATFGETKALVIERFDRSWRADGTLFRLPQEDFCQALSVPPTRKYQSDGGPSLKDILTLLKGADDPQADQMAVLKAQILFWLISATDGHAKNFSVFLGPEGTYRLTPLYDILTAQPSLAAGQIERKQMKLAMSVGTNNHYRIDEIHGRHFLQMADKVGLSKTLVHDALAQMHDAVGVAIEKIEGELPPRFPEQIHDAVSAAVKDRLRSIQV
ncbi:MAG: type II toxin-antitoxin system HipA family toxin [Alphaproteobacteria bacterium]|nr:type II toxin-antitoxin system HipA family toxin [Alphaproteobacteria bacterium]